MLTEEGAWVVSGSEKNNRSAKGNQLGPLPTDRSEIFLLIVDLFLCGKESVAHERADGHRAYSAWNRGDERALIRNIGEINVTAKTETALAGGVRHMGGA